MTLTAAIILLTQLCTLAAAIMGAVVAFRKLNVIHIQMNSRLDELLKTSVTAAHAAGVLEQKNKEPE